jgi:DNA-binding LytR/AlgR family response regulator
MIQNEPDVIFQDIEMQGVNGLDLADEYRRHQFAGKVVFVTAYSKYAIEAIKKGAFDYLLKPVDLTDLNALILKLLTEQKKRVAGLPQNSQRLKIPTRTGYLLMAKEDIAFCEADGNYTKIVKYDGDSMISSLHLGKVEEELDEVKFFRISRSVIINLDFLVSVNKGKRECLIKVLNNEYLLRISGKRIVMLEERL